MDSLKLDRLRKLLNRQYTTINLFDAINSSSAIAITSTLPNYIIKDNPKPAILITRKLFCDYVELVEKKVDAILTPDRPRDKPIFKSLQRKEDPIYDQILYGLSVISEYCLPSLLTLLLAWHQHQLSTDEHNSSTANSSLTKRPQSSLEHSHHLQQNNCEHQSQECCCTPSCNSEAHSSNASTTLTNNNSSISAILRSPTPSSPDTTSNQISITSSLSLDYQSPVPLTTIIQSNNNDFHQSSSAPNTSTSTATNASSNSLILDDSTNAIKRSELIRTRKLLVEFAFCQALVEIFSKLYLHPGHEDLIGQVEDIAFDHFKHVEGQDLQGIDLGDVNRLADKYAEVIGVLAQTRFRLVKKRFFAELNELRSKEPTPVNIQAITTLLSGMKYFRVKMAPIEEFEASFHFLQECADYFIELRHKSIKHALADLFVEIMLPLASTVKNEVKIPCLKNFVDTLWTQTLDMCARKKHSTTLFPLVTCLLCVSQRMIFLQNWGTFLNMCLSNLKNRDQKMCRIALESLYRLIWVYMIRVKCESNNVTQARLQSIVDALFPRGSRQIVPRDTPLNIFVDIIQFIAQERLDFAMRHIIFDLLSVDRPIKVIISPERMNIGLQAFLVIADSLQQKEGDPTMPASIDLISHHKLSFTNSMTSSYHHQCENSSCAMRRAHHAQHKMLNDDTAKSIGLHPYYNHIQKSFNEILKALDAQFGRPLLLTSSQNTNKEPDDMITGDRKPKVDLFKTCIAAIPRLIPDGMSKSDLIDLLSRMTVHVDEEMRKYAFESLQILVTDFQDWRLDAIEGFTLFLANQIDESLRGLVDNALKMLLQLLISWREVITSNLSSSSNGNDSETSSVVNIQTGYETISSRHSGTGGQIAARKNRALAEMRLIQSELSNTRFDRLVNVIQKVEGASLVMLCSCHQPTRKLATFLLKECRSILKCYSSWTCMEQFGFRSPDDADEEDFSASLKGSLSADNLSRITATSANGPAHSSVTSMNTQAILSTSVSKMCISSLGANQQQHSSSANQQHDLYDEDIENNLLDCYSSDDNSTRLFWIAVMLLESDKEHEYVFALRLLRKILPNLPFEQQDFLDELERNLRQMEWDDFSGIYPLVLKGCASSSTYDLCIALLDHLTPILKHPICTASSKPENCLPFHVIVLSIHLLSTYEDPTPFSLNVARRLALCCEENSQKLENLSAVMTLYSRRSFSKDAFQWIKCVAKYLHDAYPQVLPNVTPLLVDILERGPKRVQRIIAPILYCMLAYIDINSQPPVCLNADLVRIYSICLGSPVLWSDVVQLFKLIISKSSYLANGTNYGESRELPGRTMDFAIEIESLPVISNSRLIE